jgi:ABC-2 type transport system ATP-binding protein
MVFGHDVVREPHVVRKEISYLPEEAGAYENLSGREYLAFMAAFFDGEPEAMVTSGIEIASLGERIDSKIKEYSKGMKRRLLIGRTMMTSPRLAIMDEVTSGLDVMHAQHVRRKIREAVQQNQSTALVSSHNLLEVEFLCDRVALIDHGRILEAGTPADLKARHGASNLEQVFVEAVQHA